MADVTERMLGLLSTLQSGRSFSGDELTRRLNVSPRTLRRDVERLRGYGYPVETQPGPGGYYRLRAGRTLPPLVLDDDEAVATLLALASLAAAQPSIEPSTATSTEVSSEPSTHGRIDDAATRAFGKLDQFLPARLRPRVTSIRASLETSPQRAPAVTARQFSVIADAIAHQETITFTYRDARGVRADRRVEPYRQVHHLLRWYLLGWDVGRDDWRVFRLDRVADLRRTGETFRERPLPAESALAYLQQGLNKDKHAVDVLVDAPAARVLDALKYQNAEVQPVDDGRTRVTLALDSWQWLVLNLAFLGASFHISAGPEITQACRAFGERLVDATKGRPQWSGLS